jgi:two-component system cell cycle sensor histidine kinase/response regulator CckA
VFPSKGGVIRATTIFVLAAAVGGFAYTFLAKRVAPSGTRTYRIGFESNPPFQIRTNRGFDGLAVEIVDQAAKRAGVHLQWIDTGTSSEEAFDKGLVDLWPLMTDLPERRRRVHFTAPWVISSHVLLLRSASATPESEFSGRIAVFNLPLHLRLLKREFPQAQPVPHANAREVLQEVCSGRSAAGFLEKRVALSVLKDQPPICAVRLHALPDLTFRNCLASTFEAAPVADELRREIGNLFRDGTLAQTVAKYSFYGMDDAWATYDLLQAAERGKLIAWGTGALAIILVVAFGQTVYIRQRRRTERVLRENEERFRAIFQQAGVGVAQIDLNGKVQIANDRYCEVVGHSRHDLVGKETREITHSQDWTQEAEVMPRLLAGEVESFSTEKRYIQNDGTVVWATLCRTVVRDGQGRPKSLIAVVEDVTERKRAEAALKESEQRFRNLADSAPALIWMVGPDKDCTFFNRSWLQFASSTLDREVEAGWESRVHPDDRERCRRAYATAFDSRRDFEMEHRLVRGDGKTRWVLSRGVARSLPDGAFAGYVVCSLDITDLKRNYEQHLASQKLESVGVLAAGVAHDFNNLLGAISALAESAHSRLPPGSPEAEDIENVRQTAIRAAQISSQLMTFTVLDDAPAMAIDLSSVIGEMLELLRVSISKRAVLHASLAPDLPPLMANPSEMRQIVMNLVINASEALEDNAGVINVVTAPEKDESGNCSAVRLDVCDTGVGMTAEAKARLFDPFFTTRSVGRGLGLSAVQGIVRRVGGSIEVESASGEGSRFVVRFPPATERRLDPEAAPAANKISKSRTTVLFIDDEDLLRSSIAKLLRRKNFNVIEAADGPAGIAAFEAGPDGIDLVLLDVTLPGMSGREAFDKLRAIRPAVNVVLCTAYSEETVITEFGARRIEGFIRKPYRIDDLLKVLQKTGVSKD